MSSAPNPTSFRDTQHYITDHDGSGTSIFHAELSGDPNIKPVPGRDPFFIDLHTTNAIPVSLSEDLKTTATTITENQQIAGYPADGGAAFRITLSPPGMVSPLHRTTSVDYGVVLDGEIELLLDSGEKKLLKRGDTVVQRATMHQWRNPSETEWARLLFVIMPIEKGTEVARKVLETEFRKPTA